MLLTLEIVVFSFATITTLVTALVKLLNVLNTLQVTLARLEGEIANLRQHAEKQETELDELRRLCTR